MLLAGHTMATPELTLEEGLILFGEIGLDGVEIVYHAGYKCGISEKPDSSEIRHYKDILRSEKLEVAAITPYINAFNSLDEKTRSKNRQECLEIIETAYEFNAHAIRIYAGSTSPEDSEKQLIEKRKYLIEELYYLGGIAEKAGVFLVVENHFNTMAENANKTNQLILDIEHPWVRILYDQANLDFTFMEPFSDAIDLQKEFIAYVHVKDLIIIDREIPFRASNVEKVDKDERNVRSRVVGTGELDWTSILKELVRINYDGWLSLEYERRWHPQDLPPAEQGLRSSAIHIRNILQELDKD